MKYYDQKSKYPKKAPKPKKKEAKKKRQISGALWIFAMVVILMASVTAYSYYVRWDEITAEVDVRYSETIPDWLYDNIP